mmetsp:Transcript_35874/g.66944  ORF Transcript_35874/g.66944 Transcript_35874/m.66944 type:complete len:637 (+) Transcript_35874:150-2060(+)
MSTLSCKLCDGKRRHDSKSDVAYDQILQEAKGHLEYLTANVFPNHFNLKEDVQKSLQDKFIYNQKYILYNKMAYFSMKSIEARGENMSVMKRIERKKFKLMEKTVQSNKKKAQLKNLRNEKRLLEEHIRSQESTSVCLKNLSKSLLLPLLDHSRLRLVVNSFLKFPIICQHDTSMSTESPPVTSNRHASRKSIALSGVSSILGIPLPDGGDYSLIPPHIVCSALGHVVHLLAHLARVLNIPLPHPLLPFDQYDFAIIKPYGHLTRHIPLTPAFKPPVVPPSPTSAPGHSLTPSQAYEVFNSPFLLSATSVQQATKSQESSTLPWPVPSFSLSEKGLDVHNHENGTRNGQSGSGSYRVGDRGAPLSDLEFEDVGTHLHREHIFHNQLENSGVNWTPNPDFSSGLLLLQANIVHLCLTVGMKPHHLWPPKAILRNLNILNQYCLEKTVDSCEVKNTTLRQKGNYSGAATPKSSSAPAQQQDNFLQLGKCLKAYCEVIQAKPKQKSNRFNYTIKTRESDIALRDILATNREEFRNCVESNLYAFDVNKFKKVDHWGNSGCDRGQARHSHSPSLSTSSETDVIDDEADLVHISYDYDYIESDEDSVEDPYSTDSGGVDELGFAYEESFVGDIDDDMLFGR